MGCMRVMGCMWAGICMHARDGLQSKMVIWVGCLFLGYMNYMGFEGIIGTDLFKVWGWFGVEFR